MFRVIKQVNKRTGGEAQDVNLKPMAKPPVDLKVVHHLNQPMADSSFPGYNPSQAFLISIYTEIKHSKAWPSSVWTGCDIQGGNCGSVCSSLAEHGKCQCTEGFALSRQGTHCEG